MYRLTADILAKSTLITGFKVSPVHSKGTAKKQRDADHRQQPHPKTKRGDSYVELLTMDHVGIMNECGVWVTESG